MTTHEILIEAKNARIALMRADSDKKNEALEQMACALLLEADTILKANAVDLEAAQGRISEVMQDRLRLSKERIEAMAAELERKWKHQKVVTFSELTGPRADRYDQTLTFMSLLEMIKMQEVNATQDQVYGEIEISQGKRNEINVQ